MNKNVPSWIVVHHSGGSDSDPLSDSSNFTFEQCNELHKRRFGFISTLGFYVGYQYFIDKKGTIRQARADNEEGAHTIGYNTQSIGICLAGNFDVTLPTTGQIEALKGLLERLSTKYNIPKENIKPHRYFTG